MKNELFINDLEKDLISETIDKFVRKSTVSKIAIVGLAKAGKTSLKKSEIYYL